MLSFQIFSLMCELTSSTSNWYVRKLLKWWQYLCSVRQFEFEMKIIWVRFDEFDRNRTPCSKKFDHFKKSKSLLKFVPFCFFCFLLSTLFVVGLNPFMSERVSICWAIVFVPFVARCSGFFFFLCLCVNEKKVTNKVLVKEKTFFF